jgi:UDP-N-acetyl-D-glucosamine dehydrogenase
MRTLNYKTRFIDLASEINAEMPLFVVGKVREALNRAKKSVNGARVLVLGVAYKKDIDDVRESPALDIMKLLEGDGAHVEFHDPYVPVLKEDGTEMASVALTDEVLSGADAVVIITDHSSVDYERVVRLSAILVDARNATAHLPEAKAAASRPGGARWIVKG